MNIKIAQLLLTPQVLKNIPREALRLRDEGLLHKYAADREGLTSFGIKEAIYSLGKKAYLNKQEWSLIGDGLDSLDKLNK
jgi:hypothetical protein